MIGSMISARQAVKNFSLARSVIGYVKKNAPILTETEVGQYNGAGFLIIDPEVPDHLLDRAVRDVSDRPEVKGVRHHGTRVFNGWKFSPAIKQIALAPRVLRILRQLYGREPLPFQTLNFPIGTEQKPHSDAIHFNCDPMSYMCGVWVALEDIDLGNGALVYYPGSHKLPMVKMEDVAPEPGTKNYHLYEAYMERMVQEKKLTPARAILRKGQALIWASNLIHGGGSHTDKARTRHSQVTHYYFEGCQYYMPLESYGGYRHLRFEEWIR